MSAVQQNILHEIMETNKIAEAELQQQREHREEVIISILDKIIYALCIVVFVVFITTYDK